LAEEEARIKALQEEDDRKFREEEAKEEAERKAIEDEKERKRKAKQDKMDSQKAAGTYMTKAEKEKAKKLQERLESMKLAGMLPGALTQPDGSSTVAVESGKASALYGKKKPSANTQKQAVVEPKVIEEEVAVESPISPAVEIKKAATGEWDDDEDDWESSTNFDKISAFADERAMQLAEDVEDTLVLEQKVKFEQLRLLGIERAKRDEETRLRR
jgi:translation initiation factor 5B